jgi:hypothetical protein
MSAGKAFFRLALSLMPLLVEWVADRLEAGEDVETVRRDIEDQRQSIREKREARDKEFEQRFGRKPSSAADTGD